MSKKRKRPTKRGAPSDDTAKTPLDFPSRLTKPRLWAALGVVVAMSAAALLVVLRTGESPESLGGREPLPAPSRPYVEPVPASAADFVGSEACAGCHRSQFETWSRSTHAAAGGTPGATRILPGFDGSPIRFRDAVVIPERRAGTWRFVVRQEGRPERVFPIAGIVGGGHMEGGGTQGFVSRWADGTVRFLPFDFIRRENTWFCNTSSRANRGWIPITPDVKLADCGDWPPSRVLGDELRFTNCQSCHGSQIAVTADTVAHAYRTAYTSLGINCESCHGPGKRHLADVADPVAVAAGEIAMRPLATLTKDGSLGVCWQCHALKDQLRPGHRSGQSLDAYYSTLLPQLGDEAHLPDGRVRTFAYQQGHLYSDCYVNGGMTCTSCHDPHSQRYRDAQGRPLDGRLDNRQCTACHASKALQPEQHTKHAASSAGSRCVACHMPYLQEPEVGATLRYARSDHSIPIPRPVSDSTAGVVSACRTCHTDKAETVLDRQVTSWYGELKPVAPSIASVVRGRAENDAGRAAPLLLLPGSPHTAAVFAGLSTFADRHLGPDMTALDGVAIDRLQSLATHGDLDVRSLALASLHLARGETPRVRALLTRQLRGQGEREPLVRSRWAISLGYFADKLRASGDPVAAAGVYRKALEVEPGNPRLHLNLGLALADAGRLVEAAAAYRASLSVDPVQPLALVNLGIALAGSGDREGAVAAYRRALNINSREPLAHFNMANLRLQSGELEAAAAAYRLAIDADPGLSLARFYLARILAQRGDLRAALEEIDAGLEFDAANPEGRAAREQLIRRLGASR
ncbi:MAG: tetratricopeptide repeat protein [Gemmatimonadaceae bacterium]